MHIVIVPLTQLESDLQKVKIERLRVTKATEDYMEGFEKKRTQDFKVYNLLDLKSLCPKPYDLKSSAWNIVVLKFSTGV